MSRVKNEKWKQIKEFPDYVVSNIGRIRSLITGLILKPKITNCGYLSVQLYKGQKGKTVYVHRLVAKEFIPNKNAKKYTQVNHIDGIKAHNEVSNLEWVTPSENVVHAFKTGLNESSHRKEVIQMDIEGHEIARFKSASDAGKIVGISSGNISNVCRGRGNYNRDGSFARHITAGGYKWKYAD